MELKGKKINFLGDSITEGHGTSSREHTFEEIMLRNEGLAAARNYGIGGTRIARQQKESLNNIWDQYFETRVPLMDPDADIIVIFGGTNDYGHGDAPIGKPEDRTPDTFYGACHSLFRAVIEKYPEATVVVCTPLHRYNESSPRGDGYKEPTLPLIGYVNIMREVAEYYSLPLLDLYKNSSIVTEIDAVRRKYIPDGLHPNDAGHKILASRIAGFLKTL